MSEPEPEPEPEPLPTVEPSAEGISRSSIPGEPSAVEHQYVDRSSNSKLVNFEEMCELISDVVLREEGVGVDGFDLIWVKKVSMEVMEEQTKNLFVECKREGSDFNTCIQNYMPDDYKNIERGLGERYEPYRVWWENINDETEPIHEYTDESNDLILEKQKKNITLYRLLYGEWKKEDLEMIYKFNLGGIDQSDLEKQGKYVRHQDDDYYGKTDTLSSGWIWDEDEDGLGVPYA